MVQPASGIVAEEVVRAEPAEGRAGGGRGAERRAAAVRVGEYGSDVACVLAARREVRFAIGPRVVGARGDDVDLLDRQVADVGQPQAAADRIEAEAERVAEAVGE